MRRDTNDTDGRVRPGLIDHPIVTYRNRGMLFLGTKTPLPPAAQINLPLSRARSKIFYNTSSAIRCVLFFSYMHSRTFSSVWTNYNNILFIHLYIYIYISVLLYNTARKKKTIKNNISTKHISIVRITRVQTVNNCSINQVDYYEAILKNARY